MDNIIGLKRTCYCNDVKNSDIGKKITLMGWVQRYRNLGGLKFVYRLYSLVAHIEVILHFRFT